jgi:hypothetical protein
MVSGECTGHVIHSKSKILENRTLRMIGLESYILWLSGTESENVRSVNMVVHHEFGLLTWFQGLSLYNDKVCLQ